MFSSRAQFATLRIGPGSLTLSMRAARWVFRSSSGSSDQADDLVDQLVLLDQGFLARLREPLDTIFDAERKAFGADLFLEHQAERALAS